MPRNQTAQNRLPDVPCRPPGILGKNSPSQGYPDPRDIRASHSTTSKPFKNKFQKLNFKNKKNKYKQTFHDKTRVLNITNKEHYSPECNDSQKNIRIIHLNIEGLTSSKAEILGKTFSNADVLAHKTQTHPTQDRKSVV